MHHTPINGKPRLPLMTQAVHECTLRHHLVSAILLWNYLVGDETHPYGMN